MLFKPMNCVILQPSYIPWRGFFHQIEKADVFVFYDDVQFDKNGWRNRNRIKTSQGPVWLTIPIHSQGLSTPINEIQICWKNDWTRKHWRTLQQHYRQAPFFERYKPLLDSLFSRRDTLLAEFVIGFTVALAGELGLRRTEFIRSSSLGAIGSKTDRVLSILGKVGSTHYITGPSARAYIEAERFADAGITLEFMNYNYPEYPQLFPPYDAQLSILDLLFMTGPDAPRLIWDTTAAPATKNPNG